MAATVQAYVPGYRLKQPAYAGNLDIMTSAALRTAEHMASRMQRELATT